MFSRLKMEASMRESSRTNIPDRQASARFIFRQYRNYNRFARVPEEDPLSMIQLTCQHAQGSGLSLG
jgi:hypothetical protein